MKLMNMLKRLEAVCRSNRYAERLYSELLYLYHLHRARELGWESKLSAAAAYLCDCLDINGAIVREDCDNVEQVLSEFSAEAKHQRRIDKTMALEG